MSETTFIGDDKYIETCTDDDGSKYFLLCQSHDYVCFNFAEAKLIMDYIQPFLQTSKISSK